MEDYTQEAEGLRYFIDKIAAIKFEPMFKSKGINYTAMIHLMRNTIKNKGGTDRLFGITNKNTKKDMIKCFRDGMMTTAKGRALYTFVEGLPWNIHGIPFFVSQELKYGEIIVSTLDNFIITPVKAEIFTEEFFTKGVWNEK